MWEDTHLDSSGFKDVNGDVEMMIAPEAYPLSCKERTMKTKYKVLIDYLAGLVELDR